MKGFDRKLLARFWSLAQPYFRSDERWRARGLLVLLVLLLLAETEFNVFFNEQSGEFTSALAARDGARFWASIRFFFALLLVAVPIYALYYFVRDSLGIRWRRWLSQAFLAKYLDGRAYYALLGEPTIDNPDQRIAEDISAFTQKSLSFLLVLVNAVFQLVAFSGVLWKISKVLVAFLLLYAALGTLVTFGVFGRRMIALNFRQLTREADYRFGLIRIRENAEAIAFYRGEGEEERELGRRFSALFQNFKELIRWTLKLNFFQYGYSLLTLGLPSVIIAPRVLAGELEVGRVVQAAGAFSAILAALTVFIDNFESLSRFAAGIDRLHSFEHALATPAEPPGGRIDRAVGSRIVLEHVTVRTPHQGRVLASDLSLGVGPGESLLIVGPSGGGKSSILRALAGLWEGGSGRIVRPPAERMLFLPQHPYMVLGTLRAQLSYPGSAEPALDSELRRALRAVNLPDLEARCGGFEHMVHFDKVLSVGEQQRLAFARVLLRRPEFVMLDEATSALDGANEAALYDALRAAGTTLVSVSHRPALLKYHEQVLELDGHGGYRLERASKYRFSQQYEEAG
ncbi:MAG TPA: ABC transporter ATP-binding protein/permease [Polyangiaceae bacterium]|nr:ABC transporter ATP-binding protein/permease [Polyangiaceae bacterium]